MNNKAYTLVEVLAVIVLLSILTTVAVPNILSAIKISKEKTLKNQEEIIERAAERWQIDHQEDIKTEIPVCQLKKDKYLNNLKNPTNKEIMDGCVKIVNNIFKYSNDCTETCSEQ